MHICLVQSLYSAHPGLTVSLIKAALRSAHGRQKVHDGVSSYSLASAMSRTYDGMMMAIPAPHWACFRDLPTQEFAHVWRE